MAELPQSQTNGYGQSNGERYKPATIHPYRSEIKAIPNLYKVWLLEQLQKDSLDLKQNDKYIFDVD